MNKITINWHIIQQCNYSCNYCFAKYTTDDRKEIHESKEEIKVLLYKVYKYFVNKYPEYSIRLNIAGGEPTLSRNLSFIIQEAHKVGFVISMITNASKLTTKFTEVNAKYMSMLAISIDSINEEVKRKIGRISRQEVLKISQIIKYIENFRKLNPKIKVKINTVVTDANYLTYLGDLIDLIEPYKWKVFQALSLTDEVYCTKEQFKIFVNNHQKLRSKIYIEKNKDMIDSYIMLDPYGRFYQNTYGKYVYSDSVLVSDVAIAFQSIKFDLNKFSKRYKNDSE